LSLGEFALEERPLRESLADHLAAVALSPLTIYWIGQAGFILSHADGPVSSWHPTFPGVRVDVVPSERRADEVPP
jgi:hypothetical protein